MKKGKVRRNKVKNAALKKGYNSKIKQEYMDLDYLHKLDDTVKNVALPDGTMVTELEYMNYFMSEWNSASVGKQSEAETNKLHRTSELVKDCTDRNNERNRDIYGIAKARGMLHRVEPHVIKAYIEHNFTNSNHVEDAMISCLDKLNKPKKTRNKANKQSGNT